MFLRATALLLCMLLFATGQARAGESFAQMFEAARELRTTDPKALGPALTRLDALAGTASPVERDRLAILRAHHMAITGDTAGAVASLRPLTAETVPGMVRYEAGALLANTYAITRQFEEALRVLERVMPLQHEVTDREIRHNGLQGAGIVYNQVGEFRTGLRYAEKVLADQPAARSRCLSSNLVLESKLGLEMAIDSAEADQAIAHCDSAREPILAGFSRGYVAAWLHGKGHTADAIVLLDAYLPRVEPAGYPLLIGQFHSALAEYRMALGQRAAAARHAEATVDAISSLKSALPLAVAYRTLYELALQDDDQAGALLAYRLFSEAERAHTNDVKSREMAYQVVRHQSLQQAQQIELLHQKNQLLELQKRVTEQRAQSWLLLTLVLVGLVASVGYWAYKTKRLQMRLKRLTEVDALTGICNRQHFSERARAALAQCERDGVPAVLVMFDLDHFKQVNDRYGHAAGDWALQRVAGTVQSLCRSVDTFGRLGGEEFAVLLPGLDEAAGLRLADDAQARLARIDASSIGQGLSISASFGVAAAMAAGFSLGALMRQADHAMYVAKRNGRRQVRVFDAAGHAETDIVTLDAADLLRGVVRDAAAPPAAATAPARRAIA